MPQEDEAFAGDGELDGEVTAGIPVSEGTDVEVVIPEGLIRPPAAARRFANSPPDLPALEGRRDAPLAPLPARRTGSPPARAASTPPPLPARPASTPPPVPPNALRPPQRKPSTPPPLPAQDDGEDGRSSLVDFEAVLSARPRPSPSERAPVLFDTERPPPENDRARAPWLGVVGLLLLAAAGVGLWWNQRSPTHIAAAPRAQLRLEPVEVLSVDPPPPQGIPPLPRTPENSEGGATPPDDVDHVSDREVVTAEDRPDQAASAVATGARPREDRRPPPRTALAPPEATASARERPRAGAPEPTAEDGEGDGESADRAEGAAPAEDLPVHPSRESVQDALSAIRPTVAACLDGQHGTVRVRIFAVRSGRITTARVEDEYYARPPTGSCIARAIRTARFPPFSDPRFVVVYPFQL